MSSLAACLHASSHSHDPKLALISKPPEMSTSYFSALELFLPVIVVLSTIDKASTCICLGESHRVRLIIVPRHKAVDRSSGKGKANDIVTSSKVNPASLTFMPQMGCPINRQLTCKRG